MNNVKWAPFLMGITVGAAIGVLTAPEAPQRWKRKARAAAGRGREFIDVLRDAAEVIGELRSLARPLETEPERAALGKLTG